MNRERIIAVEEHVATEDYLQIAHRLDVLAADRTEIGLMRTVETGPVRSALTDIDARIATMDAVGQDMAILSINPPGVQPYPAADAARLARAANDSLAGIVRSRPERFGALGTVAPQDPTAAAEEIGRIMGPLGLNGIMINSHTGGHYLDEPQFAPLLEAAAQNNAPIYLHPRMFSVAGPYDDYGMQAAVWGYQAEAGAHAMRLILGGVFDRHPNLTVVLGHLGEGIPYWLRRIDNRHAYARKIAGAAGDTPELELAPSEYFRRNFVITTSGIDDIHVLDLALHAIGDDKIMFAIDAPYEESADAVTFLRTAPITERQRSNISHRTAERVFKLRD